MEFELDLCPSIRAVPGRDALPPPLPLAKVPRTDAPKEFARVKDRAVPGRDT